MFFTRDTEQRSSSKWENASGKVHPLGILSMSIAKENEKLARPRTNSFWKGTSSYADWAACLFTIVQLSLMFRLELLPHCTSPLWIAQQKTSGESTFFNEKSETDFDTPLNATTKPPILSLAKASQIKSDDTDASDKQLGVFLYQSYLGSKRKPLGYSRWLFNKHKNSYVNSQKHFLQLLWPFNNWL